MSAATLLQTCLSLGVLLPLASFVFLVFCGARLPRRAVAHGHSHDDGGHGHGGGGGAGEPLAGWIATGAIGASLVLAVVAIFTWGGISPDDRARVTQQALDSAWLWANIGSVPVRLGVRLDSLTLIMFLMVTFTSTCIHVFSVGYMAGEARFSRFFAFLSLFCFSMLGLLLSVNLVFLFIFWELVGVCSYFLIGFWFEKKSASDAAIKAFVVNRVGDFGFMIGLGLCFAYLGDLSLDGAAAIFEAAARHAGWTSGAPSPAAALVSPERAASAAVLFQSNFLGVSLATWLGIGLFCGAIGKSAQFPLQVWLPDAMEGPTPVSALIHAATMVAAGVYLVARVFQLLTPGALEFIAVIGCITLTMAALIAIVQTDIKRVLAYSTLSQLGYMIFGLGVGAWIAALFHLLTHAFFKALLFLGSGQVIAGCHHEQDIRRMGGLLSKMPRTGATFLIAVLAISGAGVPWIGLGLGGYYSKDEILAVAYYRHAHWSESAAHVAPAAGGHAAAAETAHAPAQVHGAPNPHGDNYVARYPLLSPLSGWLFYLPLIVAYLTPFYMGRCFVLTFLGRPRDPHIHAHAHESPLMYGPLLALGAVTLICGAPMFGMRNFVANAAPCAAALGAAVDGHAEAVHHASHLFMTLAVGFAFVVGLGLAWLVYRDGLGLAQRCLQLAPVRVVHRVLINKFYFDHVYNAVFLGGTRTVALVGRLFDNWVIDGVVDNLAYLTERVACFSGSVLDALGVDGAVNGVARVCRAVGGAFQAVQTGLLRNYVLLAMGAVAAALMVVLAREPLSGLLNAALLLVALAGLLVWLRRRPTAEPLERVRHGS